MFWASLTVLVDRGPLHFPFPVGQLRAARHGEKGKQIMENTNKTAVQASGLSMKIGGTTYVIGMHFSEKSKETMEDKVRKLALQEIKAEAA